VVSLVKQKGLTHDHGVRRQVAALHVACEVQSLVSARVSNGMATGKLAAGCGSLLKLGADVLTQRRAELALALAGDRGVTWSAGQAGSDDWAGGFLNSRSASIAGGTDEIQRNNVSERVLGLPREPTFDRDLPFNQVPHN
jgi:alkylation response protein AidB-like acyl-CoA dehydrogenase